jgi:hypothetical protein
LEGSSALGLWILRVRRGIEYRPVSRFMLGARHRSAIRQALQRKSDYIVHHPVLGWTIRPNGAGGLYRANSQGLRAEVDYSLTPQPEVVRIGAFGDSFTHGDDVPVQQTWIETLSRMRPGTEVLNFGVAGYGPDQALLRYHHDGVRFQPQIVLIGFMSEDIYRSVNVFRPFYFPVGQAVAKPRFVLEGDELKLLPNPLSAVEDYQRLLDSEQSVLPMLGLHDWHYQSRYTRSPLDLFPSVRFAKLAWHEIIQEKIITRGAYNTRSEAYLVTRGILEKFYQDVLDNQSIPILVLFPTETDIDQYLRKGTTRYSALGSDFESKGLHTLDLVAAFASRAESKGISALFSGSRHYSALGHQVVAGAIHGFLQCDRLREAQHVRPR